MQKYIDLNSDLGEGFGPWRMGDDASIMNIVTSANIACGGHAGDNSTMYSTVRAAKLASVTVGAHPGFEDRQGFGRRRLPLSTQEIIQLVAAQVGSLKGIAALHNVEVSYIKPHGALGNWAAEDESVSSAIVDAAVAVLGDQAAILAISGTTLERIASNQGVKVYSEIFADRGYTPTGHLVPRGQNGAIIHDPSQACERLLEFLRTGLMPTVEGDPIELNSDSICIHGDGPNALEMAGQIRTSLNENGVEIRPFCE